MNRRKAALPVAGGLALVLSAAFIPLMKHSIDAGLGNSAKAALTSRSVHGVQANSDWASLHLKGPGSSKTAALAAVHTMTHRDAVNKVTYTCTGSSPCPGANGTGTKGPNANGGAKRTGAKSGSGAGNASSENKKLEAQIRDALGSQGVTFAPDSARLTSRAQTVLDRIARIIGKSPSGKVAIAGYTDNQGSASHNLALSKSRAQATRSYLAAHGAAASRMAAVGHGAADPVASNATAAGRASNRRIEFTVQGG